MGSLNFKAFGFEFGFFLSVRRERNEPVEAITNRCKDGKYVIFLDYDNREFEWIRDELESIQKEYCLGEIYIFESSKGSYHAVCFDKVNFSEYTEILNRSSVDPHYRKVPFTYGKRLWTLRYSAKKGSKPKLHSIIPTSQEAYRNRSTPHITLFSIEYNIPISEEREDRITDEDSLIYAEYKI